MNQAEPEPTIYWQWPGEIGTMQTVAIMVQMVNESYRSPLILERAVRIVKACGWSRDDNLEIPSYISDCEHQELLTWVKNNVSYIRDTDYSVYPYTSIELERLKHPLTNIEVGLFQGLPVFGDCATLSTYLATLLKAVDHSPKFKVVGKGKFFHHVLVNCHNVDLDPTMSYGESPKNPQRIVYVDI